jgi:hypothetical protein
MGDVRLTFAGTVEVPGKVVFIHPLHNLAVVSYDPKSIGDDAGSRRHAAHQGVEPGDDVWVVGQRERLEDLSQKTQMASVDVVSFPLSRTLRFRDSNLEAVSLINPRGTTTACWRMKKAMCWRCGRVSPSSRSANSSRSIAACRRRSSGDDRSRGPTAGRCIRSRRSSTCSPGGRAQMGLPDEWVRRFEEHNRSAGRCSASIGWWPVRPRRHCSSRAILLLAIDGKVVNRFREVERAVQKPNVLVTVWRDGAEKTLQMNTVALDGRDIDRVLIWAGATLQAPHRAMAAQRGIAPYGVFVSFFFYGSPATHYGLYAGRRITEVDGQPTADLDAFIKAVSGKPDRRRCV